MREKLTLRQLEVKHLFEERAEQGQAPPTYREICKNLGFRSPKAAFDHVVALEKKGVLTRGERSARGVRLVHDSLGIPVLGRVPAGSPREAMPTSDERLKVDPMFCGIKDRSRAFALRVEGDSMVGRQIFDGDIAVLEHGAVPQNGDIVAALVDNESTLKTFVSYDGKAWLRAENPLYRNPVPAFELQIQGVARAIIRRLKK